MSKGSVIAAWVVAAGLSFSPVANAAPVQITAFGTITSASANVPDYATGYQSPFVLGDQITALLSYDSDATFGLVPVHLYAMAYWPANGVITTGTGWSRSAWSWFDVGASDITFHGQSGDPRYGFPYFYYSAALSFSEPFPVIPPYPLDASTFLSGTMSGIYAPTPYLDSSFTARIDRITALATPVPASACLLATGLAALVGLARSKRRESEDKCAGLPSPAG